MKENTPALYVMFLGRAIYAFNWYDVSPAYPYLQNGFPQESGYIWMMFALFLIGAGLFQIPAGMLAARIGSRRTSIFGLLLMGSSAALIYVAPDLYVIIALRFITGVAAAFFFSSGISVISYLQPDRVQRNIAYYNGFFAFGAGVGILPFTFLIDLIGWRPALSLGGLITMIVAIIALSLVPEGHDRSTVTTSSFSAKLTDRYIWLISAGMGGYYALNFVLGEYFKPYIMFLGYPGTEASIVASLTLFTGLVGAMLIGHFAKADPIRQITGTILLLSLMDLSLLYSSIYLFTMIAVINGVLNVVLFSKEYMLVLIHERDRSMIPLDLGLLNSIQLSIGGVFSAVFGLMLVNLGYPSSWVSICLISIATLPLFTVAAARIKRSRTLTVETHEIA
ncbi:MAG: MFS transporter [Candidatus Thermoplasmatota archaeon]|nr:MFS transporter [Candidatus Thermoplasmatota archaeon]